MDGRRPKESDWEQFRGSAYQRIAGAVTVWLADVDAAAGQVALTHFGGAVGVTRGGIYGMKRFRGWFVRIASEVISLERKIQIRAWECGCIVV